MKTALPAAFLCEGCRMPAVNTRYSCVYPIQANYYVATICHFIVEFLKYIIGWILMERLSFPRLFPSPTSHR